MRRKNEINSYYFRDYYKNYWPIATTAAAGSLWYGSTLAVSTYTQLKFFSISTSTPAPIPTLLGFVSVCLASLSSHHCSLLVAHNLLQLKSSSNNNSNQQYVFPWSQPQTRATNATKNTNSSKRTRYSGADDADCLQFPNSNIRIPLAPLRICVVGLITFKLLGGRFWGISPSSYTNLGSFARIGKSLPATERYATPTQRTLIEKLGKTFGCHTCGSRMLFFRHKRGSTVTAKFIADHMPPKAVAKQMNERWYRKLLGREVPFRFYPQCIHCSNRQGSILSAAVKSSKYTHKKLAHAGGGQFACFHGLRFRLYHISGSIIGAVASIGIADCDDGDENNLDDLSNKSDRLYRSVQHQAQTVLKVTQQRLLQGWYN